VERIFVLKMITKKRIEEGIFWGQKPWRKKCVRYFVRIQFSSDCGMGTAWAREEEACRGLVWIVSCAFRTETTTLYEVRVECGNISSLISPVTPRGITAEEEEKNIRDKVSSPNRPDRRPILRAACKETPFSDAPRGPWVRTRYFR
jgi:hypothetical protein